MNDAKNLSEWLRIWAGNERTLAAEVKAGTATSTLFGKEVPIVATTTSGDDMPPLPSDDEVPEVRVRTEAMPSYDEVCEFLGGGPEYCPLRVAGVKGHLLIHGEGRLIPLPLNPLATLLAQAPICGKAWLLLEEAARQDREG